MQLDTAWANSRTTRYARGTLGVGRQAVGGARERRFCRGDGFALSEATQPGGMSRALVRGALAGAGQGTLLRRMLVHGHQACAAVGFDDCAGEVGVGRGEDDGVGA
jgi:hypothetical protein